jgi:hypothetical protein
MKQAKLNRRTTLAKLCALGVLAAVVSLVVPAMAHAHNVAGVPFHVAPVPEPLNTIRQYDPSTGQDVCTIFYYGPNQVYGFTREYVYWHLVTWRVRPNGQTELNNGPWQRATTNAYSGLERAFGSFLPWTDFYGRDPVQMNSIAVWKGVRYSIGYEIFWGSNSYTHREWLGEWTC